MLLTNVWLAGNKSPVNIAVHNEKIDSITTGVADSAKEPFQIRFTNALAFPGLINSHDHLDFNCFPVLNKRTYNNYTEWGNHIHSAYRNEIDGILKIPQALRTTWGMYKNLLAGVTTVVNHGAVLPIENPLINIVQDTQNLHSVQFQKKWKWKLNRLFQKDRLYVIHTGEGIDEQSAAEIDELLRWNLFNRKLVGVHAVAMTSMQAKKFAGIVWCPESNRVLLNKHADVTQLKINTRLVFGTDSTLTGNWNIWQHLRLARSLQQVNDTELLNMVTNAPAKLWGMNNGELLPGKDADMVITSAHDNRASLDTLFATNPEDILLVLHKGAIRLFDASLYDEINNSQTDLAQFNPVTINDSVKYVQGDLAALASAIRTYHSAVSFPFN